MSGTFQYTSVPKYIWELMPGDIIKIVYGGLWIDIEYINVVGRDYSITRVEPNHYLPKAFFISDDGDELYVCDEGSSFPFDFVRRPSDLNSLSNYKAHYDEPKKISYIEGATQDLNLDAFLGRGSTYSEAKSEALRVAVERGESWVKRNTREWPLGETLHHADIDGKIKFYFV